MDYMLPRGEWNWTWISFDLQMALKHLNSFLMEFREFREEVYVESLLTHKLMFGIAGLEFMTGGKRILFLILIKNDSRNKILFMELKEKCDRMWDQTHDEEEIKSIIRDSLSGKIWFAKVNIESRSIEINSKFSNVEKAKRVLKYFESIDFLSKIVED